MKKNLFIVTSFFCVVVGSGLHACQNKEVREHLLLPSTISQKFSLLKDSASAGDTEKTTVDNREIVTPEIECWAFKRSNNQERIWIFNNRLSTNKFVYVPEIKKYKRTHFDGINERGEGLVAYQYVSSKNSNPCRHPDHHRIYFLKEAKKRTLFSIAARIPTLCIGEGIIKSLMLEPDSNTFMYSVVHAGKKNSDLYLQRIVNSHGLYTTVDSAQCDTDKLFIKTVSLGKGTYLGITDTGHLYTINRQGRILYCFQHSLSRDYTFKNVAVDENMQSSDGVKSKVVLLTKNGQMYITFFGTTEQLAWLYVTTIRNPDKVKRLYYHQGVISVVYKPNNIIEQYADNVF